MQMFYIAEGISQVGQPNVFLSCYFEQHEGLDSSSCYQSKPSEILLALQLLFQRTWYTWGWQLTRLAQGYADVSTPLIGYRLKRIYAASRIILSKIADGVRFLVSIELSDQLGQTFSCSASYSLIWGPRTHERQNIVLSETSLYVVVHHASNGISWTHPQIRSGNCYWQLGLLVGRYVYIYPRVPKKSSPAVHAQRGSPGSTCLSCLCHHKGVPATEGTMARVAYMGWKLSIDYEFLSQKCHTSSRDEVMQRGVATPLSTSTTWDVRQAGSTEPGRILLLCML